MNLSACEKLRLAPLTGVWYRCIPPRFWKSSLQTRQTSKVHSRFNAGPLAKPKFEILYLCENPALALEEVEAQFYTRAGQIVANPAQSWLVMNVRVQLQSVADLTSVAAQEILETNPQELTGDWQGYQTRGPHSSVTDPVGISPTQGLGQALFSVPSLEAFQTVSAKRSDHRSLVVFPQKLLADSSLEFVNPISNKVHTIP